MDSKKLLIISLLFIAIVSTLHALQWYALLETNFYLLSSLRIAIVGLLTFYAIKKRSLTTSILVAMFIGIEVGHDFKEFALQLKVLSDIFLRLIKTIIAPLLFATLVVGIAGHSNLKQVGRMGWKSIVYFEIVTTIALFIGLAAINISKAGIGSSLQAQPNQIEKANTLLEQKQTHNFILEIFPENIAGASESGSPVR